MYAVVEIGGHQYRIAKDMKLKVPYIKSEPGGKIAFDNILMIEENNGDTIIGNPIVKDKQITATIIEHGREKKIIVFKKKRRKGYQKKTGHRQHFTLIEINDIKTVKAKAVGETKKQPVEAPKAKVKKTETTTGTKKSTPVVKTSTKSKSTAIKSESKIQKTKAATKTLSKKTTTAKKTSEKSKSTAPKAAKGTTKTKAKAATTKKKA